MSVEKMVKKMYESKESGKRGNKRIWLTSEHSIEVNGTTLGKNHENSLERKRQDEKVL